MFNTLAQPSSQCSKYMRVTHLLKERTEKPTKKRDASLLAKRDMDRRRKVKGARELRV
ncbi:hypothetical protein RchiOBHm_Chr1g0329801 [Rosa chinensis]|uniref:Uncharacterized protein n=1 Tax=Rosa chinensis TaxID=74649 RepID=A0A2P6SB56_ROSCH|nr:hypothetical protein RchiOBHm_Chr1g0329801 [Rosa chinensis]